MQTKTKIFCFLFITSSLPVLNCHKTGTAACTMQGMAAGCLAAGLAVVDS